MDRLPIIASCMTLILLAFALAFPRELIEALFRKGWFHVPWTVTILSWICILSIPLFYILNI